MTIHVKLFAILAERIGQRQLQLELPAHATVSDALEELSHTYQPVADFGDRLATALNMEYVKGGHALSDGDELSLIPPVSGG